MEGGRGVSPVWCPLLATPPAVPDCSALIWHLGPAAHWDCLPIFALPRSFMPPGHPWGRNGGAEAPQIGEGPLLLLSPPSCPSLAGNPEPSDDILLTREKDLTRLSELEQFQVIF